MTEYLKEIKSKIKSLKEENWTVTKIQVNLKTFLSILEECEWIKKEEGEYIWDKPGLVRYLELKEYKEKYPTILGYPYQVVNDILEYAVIAEQN